MPIQEVPYIWHNGQMKPWKDATTHVLAHGLHYGTSVFEGLRAYSTKHKGVVIFRLKDHTDRFFYSASVYRFDMPYDHATLMQAQKDVIVKNELPAAYIRPVAFCGYGEMGPSTINLKTEVAIAAFPWGAYLGEQGMAEGVDVAVSSWRRTAPGTVPAGVKAGGNYLSSRLIGMEAKANGFAEGIGLSHDGLVSEGAGQNIFIVRKGRIITTPAAASILTGITRDSIMVLAGKLGYEVIEQDIPREVLYAADEIFFTGTAAEVTPVRSVDRLKIGTGERPVTAAISKAFFGLFSGETEDEWGWLDPVKG